MPTRAGGARTLIFQQSNKIKGFGWLCCQRPCGAVENIEGRGTIIGHAHEVTRTSLLVMGYGSRTETVMLNLSENKVY